MIELPMERGPEKPPWGEPCNGCGVCCAAEVCPVGKAIFGDVPAPCPGMEFQDGRFWCKLVGLAEGIGPPAAVAVLKFNLGIGVGCDTQLWNEA